MLRVIELDIRIDDLCLKDRFQWDLADPQNSPEVFMPYKQLILSGICYLTCLRFRIKLRICCLNRTFHKRIIKFLQKGFLYLISIILFVRKLVKLNENRIIPNLIISNKIISKIPKTLTITHQCRIP